MSTLRQKNRNNEKDYNDNRINDHGKCKDNNNSNDDDNNNNKSNSDDDNNSNNNNNRVLMNFLFNCFSKLLVFSLGKTFLAKKTSDPKLRTRSRSKSPLLRKEIEQ